MAQQFERGILPYTPITDAEAPEIPMLEEIEEQQNAVWYTRHLRAALAVGSMVLATLGGSMLTAQSTEAASVVNAADNTDPSAYKTMTYSQKLQVAKSAAHRGITGYFRGHYANENTYLSGEKTAAKGVDIFEFDIRFTKDHIPLGIHDSKTGRLTHCNLEVATHTFNRLEHCSFRHGGGKLSSLEMIARNMSPFHNRTALMEEIKDKYVTPGEYRTLDAINDHYGFGSSNLSYESKYIHNLAAMKAIAPEVKTLYVKSSSTNPPQANELNSDVVNGVVISYSGFKHGLEANQNYVDAFRDEEMDVYPWFRSIKKSQVAYVIGRNATGFIADNAQIINSMR